MRAVEGLLYLVAALTVLAVIAVAAVCVLIVAASDRFPPKPPTSPQIDAESVSRDPGGADGSPFSPAEWDQLREFYPNWPKED